MLTHYLVHECGTGSRLDLFMGLGKDSLNVQSFTLHIVRMHWSSFVLQNQEIPLQNRVHTKPSLNHPSSPFPPAFCPSRHDHNRLIPVMLSWEALTYRSTRVPSANWIRVLLKTRRLFVVIGSGLVLVKLQLRLRVFSDFWMVEISSPNCSTNQNKVQ